MNQIPTPPENSIELRRDRTRAAALLFALAGLLVAVVFSVLISRDVASAATQAASFKWELGLSGQVITNPLIANAATNFLSVPASAQHAHFAVTGGDLCVSTGAAAPTTTSSMRWFENSERQVTNDGPMLKRMRIINCSDANPATVQVYYSRDLRVGE